MSNKPSFNHEKPFWNKNQLVIGIDEVGRGALAGPITVAGVIFPPHFNSQKISQVNDSKKLSPNTRLKLAPLIKKHALHYTVKSSSHKIIDQSGIIYALHKTMHTTLKHLPQANHLLLDGLSLPDSSDYPQKTHQTAIKKGDQISLSIAAASILAKVHRDSLMQKHHQKHPHYHWHSNKGYGTKQHIDSLKKHGLSSLHRKTFIQSFVS